MNRKPVITDNQLQCTHCKKFQSFDNYYIEKSTILGFRRTCKSCEKIKSAEYRRKVRNRNNPEFMSIVKNYALKRKYGISLLEYNFLLQKQNYKCLICDKEENIPTKNGKIKNLSVDHCHRTGKIRGLLCSRCNTGIGSFKEDIDCLLEAIEYLKEK